MAEIEQELARLHTAAIDARNGYREAVQKSDGTSLTGLFTELEGLHDRHASELGTMLRSRGYDADNDGSFMSLVHETIMDVRSLVGGLGPSILGGLIDGEKRNISKYDDALKEPNLGTDEAAIGRQRSELAAVIGRLEGMKAAEDA